ncbi:hypothetical protein V5799_007671 [Amblyomma americanum]|uniref:Uncharacterized protein n=1 Tax=Amblyomma americanum TaxID=6943 RepID=A0AAQ4FFA6_AMBAM
MTWNGSGKRSSAKMGWLPPRLNTAHKTTKGYASCTRLLTIEATDTGTTKTSATITLLEGRTIDTKKKLCALRNATLLVASRVRILRSHRKRGNGYQTKVLSPPELPDLCLDLCVQQAGRGSLAITYDIWTSYTNCGLFCVFPPRGLSSASYRALLLFLMPAEVTDIPASRSSALLLYACSARRRPP